MSNLATVGIKKNQLRINETDLRTKIFTYKIVIRTMRKKAFKG